MAVLLLALPLAACAGLSPGSGTLRDVLPVSTSAPDGGSETSAGTGSSQPATSITVPPTTQGSPTTDVSSTDPPVETTVSSPDEGAPDEEDGMRRPAVWIVVAGLVVLLFAAGWAAGRARRPQAPPAPGPPTWRDSLSVGYDEARRLQAVLTDDYAVSMAAPREPATRTPAEGLGYPQRQEVERHLQRAGDALRRAQDAAPDATSSHLIGALADALVRTDGAVEARATAHAAVTAQPADAAILERERVAVTRLAETRAELESALAAARSLL